MPFNSNEVYVMDIPDTPTKPQIVLGAYHTKALREGDEMEPAIQYWYTSGLRPFHTIFGEITEDAPKMIKVKSRHFIYHFEPLTLDRWRELGESGNIRHYEHIKDDFATDDELKNYYITTFLPLNYKPIPYEPPSSDKGESKPEEPKKE